MKEIVNHRGLTMSKAGSMDGACLMAGRPQFDAVAAQALPSLCRGTCRGWCEPGIHATQHGLIAGDLVSGHSAQRI